MGEVYEATHERLAHRYAVKFLHPGVRDHPEALPRFMREAQVTSLLRHPAIVSVVDFNTLPDGSAYLVMEYLEGESLGKVLARTGPLPLQRVVDITDQISAALTAAHLQGVVHRDMHPQNVFVMPGTGGQSERIKVLDFGISKIASISQKITGMAAVMGTPQYMSPEQAEGKARRARRGVGSVFAGGDRLRDADRPEGVCGRDAGFGRLPDRPRDGRSRSTATVPSCRSSWRTSCRAASPRTRGTDSRRCPSSRCTCAGPPRCPPARSRPARRRRRRADAGGRRHRGDDGGLRAALGDGGRPAREHRIARRQGQRRQGPESGNDELTVVDVPREPTHAGMRREPTDVGVPLTSRRWCTVPRQPPAADRRRRGGRPGRSSRSSSAWPRARAGRRSTPPRRNRPPAAPPPARARRGTRRPRRPRACAPRSPPPAVADGAAAAAIPAPAPTEMDTPDPPAPRQRGRRRAQVARADAAARRRRRQGPPPRPRRSGHAAGARNAGSAASPSAPTRGRELWIDGADTGQHTPVVDLPVACGTHRLEFKRRDLKISQIENVTLNEGREFRRQYELHGSDVDE